jgi:hypothetical protein
MSPDPAAEDAAESGSPQAWNQYAYVGNNPTSRTDPSGERYSVCQKDENGKDTNCADISDEQFAQFEQANKDTLTFEGNGEILQNGTVIGSYQQTSVDATEGLLAVGTGTQMAASTVNAAFQGLRTFGYMVAPPIMAAADCLAGSPDCTKTGVALALMPGGEEWRALTPLRPLSGMGHAAKHLKEFQELDPSLTSEAVAKILTYVKETFPGVAGRFGGTEHVGAVAIGGKQVTVKVIVTSAGNIKTGYPLR